MKVVLLGEITCRTVKYLKLSLRFHFALFLQAFEHQQLAL